MNALPLASTRTSRHGRLITNNSSKSSKQPSLSQPRCISQIIHYRELFNLTLPTTLLVLFLVQEYTNCVGAIIHQPIAFASHKYSGAAVNWDTFKQESYALYYAVTQFNYYLRGKPFLMETDHRNLVWIETSHVPIVVRWRVLLQSFVFDVKHIPGKNNTVADWLSRMYPLPTIQSSLSTISTPLTIKNMFSAVHGGRSLHHEMCLPCSLSTISWPCYPSTCCSRSCV